MVFSGSGRCRTIEVLRLFRSARAVLSRRCGPIPVRPSCSRRWLRVDQWSPAASGGIVDMVVDGVTGLLVPPGDVPALAQAIASVLSDPRTAPGVRRRGTRPRTRIHRQRRCRTNRAHVRQRHRADQGRSE